MKTMSPVAVAALDAAIEIIEGFFLICRLRPKLVEAMVNGSAHDMRRAAASS